MGTKMNYKPEVYVGTYRKYNNGNLDGGWLTLTDYASYSAFMDACYKLHKDEKDPELMIQDTSDMPDGLCLMDSISEQEFNDIIEACKEQSDKEEAEEQPKFEIIDYSEKAIALVGDTKDIKDKLKELGGRFNPRLSCGAGWIFSKKKQAELEQLLQGGKVEKSEPKQREDDSSAVWKKNLEEFCASKKDADYYRKQYLGAVKVDDGYIMISKPSIETKFCFADEGPDYEYYKELMADNKRLEAHFMADNLSGLDKKIKDLESGFPMVVSSVYYDGRKSYCRVESNWPNPDDKPMSAELRAELIRAYRWSRSMFEKRLQSYLKRYGTSKLHTWTYWRDA